MTIEPTDAQVWVARDAAKGEAARWRIIEFKGRGAIAVNDVSPLPDYELGGGDKCTQIFERFDFKDAMIAREYIEWRSIKAALIAYEKIGKGNSQ